MLGLYGWGGTLMLAARGAAAVASRRPRPSTPCSTASRSASALFTAVTVCAYSVVDGYRRAAAAGPGMATAYSTVLFVGIAPVVVAYALARRGTRGVCTGWRRSG